ncbi:hypothetical protein AK812_SmicGene34704 [Symbiodinium microadriaticum]|uniref:Uncharacterized protein n=1 Tax=Symbiodinium microadriaticum TaxID=2951 RepID=A0A1Q9CNC4_SYMMI|nr:hypothetical protein AK812_SmicGene34704 [Symbiodinium microadriaticum]
MLGRQSRITVWLLEALPTINSWTAKGLLIVEAVLEDYLTVGLHMGLKQLRRQLLADGTLMDVTWSDYESLYAQWKTGLVDDSTVRQAGGLNLLDLMQTQYILDVDESQTALSSSTTTTSFSTVARVPSPMPTSTESLLG